MTTPSATWVSAGGEALQWTKMNAGLHMTGSAGLTAANTGTSSNMARHRGLTTAPFTLGEAVSVDVPGDDGIVAAFLFSSDTAPEFDLGLSVFDQDFYTATNAISGVTLGETRAVPLSIDSVTPTSMALMLTRKTKQVGDIGSGANTGYEHLIILAPDIRFQTPGDYANKTHNDLTYRVKCNSGTYWLDGRTIAEVFPTAPNSRAAAVILRSENRLSWAALVGDGTTAAITTTHAPNSTVGKHIATKETTGFATATVTAVDNTAPTYTITAGAAVGSGKFEIVMYELSGNFS